MSRSEMLSPTISKLSHVTKRNLLILIHFVSRALRHFSPLSAYTEPSTLINWLWMWVARVAR